MLEKSLDQKLTACSPPSHSSSGEEHPCSPCLLHRGHVESDSLWILCVAPLLAFLISWPLIGSFCPWACPLVQICHDPCPLDGSSCPCLLCERETETKSCSWFDSLVSACPSSSGSFRASVTWTVNEGVSLHVFEHSHQTWSQPSPSTRRVRVWLLCHSLLFL